MNQLEKLKAEQAKIEQQIAQEQHKLQRLRNRKQYYEKWRTHQARPSAYYPWRCHRKHCPGGQDNGRAKLLCTHGNSAGSSRYHGAHPCCCI